MAFSSSSPLLFFFFNDTATTEIYTLSLHDALPIARTCPCCRCMAASMPTNRTRRSEEHTSELQSRGHLVCRLLLEKKKDNRTPALGAKLNLHQEKLGGETTVRTATVASYSKRGRARCPRFSRRIFFFFNDTATTEIYTLSLHDALPI